MYTLGYRFKPWRGDESAGRRRQRSCAYIRETAPEYDVDRHIRYDHRVTAAAWDSETSRWTVTADHDGEPGRAHLRAALDLQRLLRLRRRATPPTSRASSGSRGTVVHPQHWPEDLDYAGKRVVVIGSGATAVTLVPALAGRARGRPHVTMLQRSPTYVLSVPGTDPIDQPAAPACCRARLLHRHPLEERPGLDRALPAVPRARPDAAARHPAQGHGQGAPRGLRRRRRTSSRRTTPGTSGSAWSPTATSSGDPAGRASVVTDTIETFTETGVRLASGPGARGRRRRHGDRPRAACPSAASPSPSTAPRFAPRDDGLQGADARRGAQPRLHRRLHQRLVDPQGRPGRRLRRAGC